MSNKLLNFKGHECFYKYLNGFLPAFDIRNSVARGRFTFIYNGEVKPYRNLYQFLGEINVLLEADLFCIKKSRITSRTRYKIFVDSEVEAKLNSEESDAEVVVEKPLIEGTGEAVMASHYAPVITQEDTTVEDQEAEFAVDWAWVESLEDTPENKLALDEYAEKNSDVKLKRNMKLVNMVRAYKKALS